MRRALSSNFDQSGFPKILFSNHPLVRCNLTNASQCPSLRESEYGDISKAIAYCSDKIWPLKGSALAVDG
jgi:hypothetical protein